MSLYFCSNNFLAAYQASPDAKVSGITSATTPPLLTLASAKSMKFDARPAKPLPALSSRSILLSFFDIRRCSSSVVPNPAKDGIGVPILVASCPVGRVKGGFIITKSKDS